MFMKKNFQNSTKDFFYKIVKITNRYLQIKLNLKKQTVQKISNKKKTSKKKIKKMSKKHLNNLKMKKNFTEKKEKDSTKK